MTDWRFPLVVFLLLIAGLAAMATANDKNTQYYFAAIGLMLVLGLVAVLALLARGATEGRDRLYFGAISTLLASVAGLTGGIAGGAVVGDEQGETAGRQAGARVAVDEARRTAADTAADTARRPAKTQAERTGREELEDRA